MNSKLDALILAVEQADNRVIGLENKTDEDAAEAREAIATALEQT
jgi:low affinity Fe/Cu permease